MPSGRRQDKRFHDFWAFKMDPLVLEEVDSVAEDQKDPGRRLHLHEEAFQDKADNCNQHLAEEA